MVMDGATAQSVGREFVRQYYTILNKEPLKLHRFYSEHSSFVHGGIEQQQRDTKPIIGPEEVLQKIVELNFCNCHAKIHQVDSYETLQNGLIVQVLGELSNNGCPMRRFVQSFVLGFQPPKSYYVHNDIFRYLDDLLEEDIGETSPSDQEDIRTEDHVNQDGQYFDKIQHHANISIVNGPSSLVEIVNSGNTPMHVAISAVEDKASKEEASANVKENVEVPKIMEDSETGEHDVSNECTEGVKGDNETSSEKTEGSFNNGQKNWSTATSSDSWSSSSKVQWSSVQNHVETKETSFGGTPHRFQGRSGGMVRSGQRDRQRLAEENGGGTRQYPDANQLFIGNLPHSVGEEELKEFFRKFGTVLDLRINSKPNKIGPGGTRVPNFGFVVFEDPDVVQIVLDNKPISYQNHRLNVEEKKTRSHLDGPRMNSTSDGSRPSHITSRGGGRGGVSIRGGHGSYANRNDNRSGGNGRGYVGSRR